MPTRRVFRADDIIDPDGYERAQPPGKRRPEPPLSAIARLGVVDGTFWRRWSGRDRLRRLAHPLTSEPEVLASWAGCQLLWRWSSLAGCDCGFDVVEEGLEYPVMKRLDPLTPDRLPLPGRAAFDRVAKDGRVVGTFQLEPLLALQLGRPDHPERTGGTWAVDLFPEHQPCVVQMVSLRPGSGSDLRRPDTVEVGDERGYLLRRCRDSPFMVVLDLHPSSTSG